MIQKKKINSILGLLSVLLLIACVQSKPHYIGEEYVGAKYANGPLGEGKAPDTDPLIRFDAFDCVTFVETALAKGDLEKLNKIRYKDGKVDFLTRNHFTELDWVQNNSDIVENVSSEYGKTKIRTVVIDKQNWFKKVHHIDVKIPRQTVDIEYIPYSEFDTIDNKEPLIVLFVVKYPNNKIGTDLGVVHIGFLLPNNILRHASSDQGYVVDADFTEYVNSRKKAKNNLGIALLKIKDVK